MSDFPAAPSSNQFALQTISAPATKSDTAVHAAVSDTAANAYPGPFTNPDVPRNLSVKYGAAWDGGDVTVVGTDQFGNAVSETFAFSAGTVVGTKIFKTVTSASKTAIGVGVATASIGTGNVLGLTRVLAAAVGVVAVDGLTEAATWKTSASSVAPTSAPNGSRVYTILHPV